MKILAMYLPQFHRVQENDEWWGEGFTEWTSVRSAKPLFPEHDQPHAPLHENYYDLMNPETMRWQADLMHHYGVDGMCFYHYYFKDGRRILERPAENLLHWKDIDMPFCFSWANEAWIRSWSRLTGSEGNAWASKFDQSQGKDEDGILLAQEYGDETDWRAHYAYLSPFFHDKRYILQEGMPLFLIYKPEKIPCIREMLACWDKLAKADGFAGIYTIGTMGNGTVPFGLKGANLPEPQDTMSRFFPKRFQNIEGVQSVLDYRDVWQKLVGKPVHHHTMLGGFVGYDDTPRQGRNGTVVRGRSPEVFYRGMKALIAKARKVDSPYIFLNAWNEWGEGMHLEPDERFGYAFLEALKKAREEAETEQRLSVDASASADLMDDGRLAAALAENEVLQERCSRYHGYWSTLEKWLALMENRNSIAEWLRTQGIHNVAIYGMGMLGRHLYRQLQAEGFPVAYAIDQSRMKGTEKLPVYPLDADLSQVDAVIVTVLYDFEQIRDRLAGKGLSGILPLDQVLQRAGEEANAE